MSKRIYRAIIDAWQPKTCQWIGQGEGCKNSVLNKKSYCSEHYHRIYVADSTKVEIVAKFKVEPLSNV